VLGFDAVGTNINHYWNGTTNGSGNISVTPADGGSPLRVGSRADLVTMMKGDIAELLIYNQGLSETDRNSINTYLAAKYGVPFIQVNAGSGGNGPKLSISGQTTSGFTISWPADVTGFVLESAPTLTKPTWTLVSGVQNNKVVITPTGTAQFFRLRQP
jgi:hypothetical protein